MRKKQIMALLEEAKHPIKGAQLAEMVNVSRQVVVQDIAVMRAQGVDIIATPQGYMLHHSAAEQPQKLLACCHKTIDEMTDELTTIVSYGGHVLNVIVEHPVYGEIQGNLLLNNLYEVDQFMEKVRQEAAVPLSALTNGVHLHTVEASSWEILEQVAHKLMEKHYLIEQDYSAK